MSETRKKKKENDNVKRKNKYLRIQAISSVFVLVTSCVFTWSADTACSHLPYYPKESCYYTVMCCGGWFENYKKKTQRRTVDERGMKQMRKEDNNERTILLIYVLLGLFGPTNQIVLSGSGRRNLMISPPRIHMNCVKFHNS